MAASNDEHRGGSVAEAYKNLVRDFDTQFRFGACNPADGHSTIWRVWPQGDDLYLAARCWAGTMKVSFHASGNARIALSAEGHQKTVSLGLWSAGDDRAMTKWHMPAPTLKNAVGICRILFPAAHLKLPPPRDSKPKVVFEVEEDSALEMSIFFAYGDRAAVEEGATRAGLNPLVIYELQSGKRAIVCARSVQFDPNIIPSSERMNNSTMRPLSADPFPRGVSKRDGLTALFWNDPNADENRELKLIEVSGVTVAKDD